MTPGAESQRLAAARDAGIPWKKWGPYLSERQWGTVREDYSEDGNAWGYFTHDQARSRAYRWGEDGIGGFSDDKQHLCFALALWNGNDPILKERHFGLTNAEGNHGEDVKEYYFYLDSTPTHAYMKQLYKYPQAAFPYADLVAGNAARGRDRMEYELIDTGVFGDDRYFDVTIEYAKSDAEDILIRISATNRGDAAAPLRILPTLWFRNTWTHDPACEKPVLRRLAGAATAVHAEHPLLGAMRLFCEGDVPLYFTENETNSERIFGTPNATPYVKDGINDRVVHGRDTVNPDDVGTKVAAEYACEIAAGATAVVRLRLARPDAVNGDPFGGFDAAFAERIADADAFYGQITAGMTADAALVTRQALAGMLWSKQYFNFDLDRWLAEHGVHRHDRGETGGGTRNREWFHMLNDDVISMPDKWEYPWYAAWDLAFHTIPLAMVDPDFAKDQLRLMLTDLYIHPNGQLPAYEWNFSDVNPPVHAFACKLVYDMDKAKRGVGDVAFLSGAFNKLLLNFTWWVNQKDKSGRNLFEGGFLGLDNIGVFDRSAPLPTGGTISQADGTAWMAFYALSMLDIAAELAQIDASFEDMVVKFAEHFLWIALAVLQPSGGKSAMWDEEDGFFYDVLELPDGTSQRLKVRSLVGLLPLCAVMVFDRVALDRVPTALDRIRKRMQRMPEIAEAIPFVAAGGVGDSRMLALVDETKLRRILTRLLDEDRFWGPHGVRSISRDHLAHPYVLYVDGHEFKVQYLPAESDTGMFGGNSNWRGPVWMPMNALLVRALIQFYRFYGDEFTVEHPTGSGVQKNLFEIASDLCARLEGIFLRDADGRRPVFGGNATFQHDPHWRDLVPFYEYFHGDNGAGLGASHQTGWTGLIAYIMQSHGHLTSDAWLERGRAALLET